MDVDLLSLPSRSPLKREGSLNITRNFTRASEQQNDDEDLPPASEHICQKWETEPESLNVQDGSCNHRRSDSDTRQSASLTGTCTDIDGEVSAGAIDSNWRDGHNAQIKVLDSSMEIASNTPAYSEVANNFSLYSATARSGNTSFPDTSHFLGSINLGLKKITLRSFMKGLRNVRDKVRQPS